MKLTGYRCQLIWQLGAIAILLATVAGAQNQPKIQQLIFGGRLEEMRWPNFSDYAGAVNEFYVSAGYAHAWVQDGQPSRQALAMIELFKSAWQKGLEPEDYDASRWEGRLAALRESNHDADAFDVALTICAMRYIAALHVGRVNPQHVNFALAVKDKKIDLAQFLREDVLSTSQIGPVLEGIEPPFMGYRRSEQALVRYVEMSRLDDGEALPAVAKTIGAGQKYPGVPRLVRLLRRTGDLPDDAVLPSDTELYDGNLVTAVKSFQRRHGLDDDGRLGSETIKQLNVPLGERVRQLQLTLERWRWLPSEFPAPPIIVNIPDFRLRALDEKREVEINMRVVVGKAIRTETPVFSRDMTYVVFRPYWNVPPSILRGEIIPAIQRNRNYITEKRYEVTTHRGTVVTGGEISDQVLAELKAGKLTVRQKPGPNNALGLVKFMFPNEYNVYLHSTPAQTLFSRSRRDFSHGCIRVENPAELGNWVLQNNSGWDLQRVEKAMQSGEDNLTVSLGRPIPVFIVYGTALAYENGAVHFYNDIYGHDATLAEALAKGYPYP